jgi:ribosomal protein L37E
MKKIIGRTAPKSQTCPRCGKMRVHHQSGLYVCSVPASVTERLRKYRDENGKAWKSKLLALWTSGKDEGDLRNARNMIGPSNLYKIDLDA